jgi:hypothetical protein
VVFFEEFAGDWARESKGAARGWRYWYEDHCGESFEIRLGRFKKGCLDGAPMR